MSLTPARDVAPPDLPRYRFIGHISAGGNAQVYLYEQDLPHRKVAVKVLSGREVTVGIDAFCGKLVIVHRGGPGRS